MLLNLQFPMDLVTFTEKILNVKLHFLCSVNSSLYNVSCLFNACIDHPNIIENRFPEKIFLLGIDGWTVLNLDSLYNFIHNF